MESDRAAGGKVDDPGGEQSDCRSDEERTASVKVSTRPTSPIRTAVPVWLETAS